MQRVKKTEIITLRVTPRTKKTIQERAKAAGLTVTDYLCYSGLGKEIVRVEGLDQVLFELSNPGAKSKSAHHPGQHGEGNSSEG